MRVKQLLRVRFSKFGPYAFVTGTYDVGLGEHLLVHHERVRSGLWAASSGKLTAVAKTRLGAIHDLLAIRHAELAAGR